MVDFHELTHRLERIYTPRLALRQVSTADAWPLFKATRNPLFNRHLLWDQPADELAVWDRVNAIVDASRLGKLSAVSAVVRETGAWVSLFRFQPYGQLHDTLDMGVWTHHAYWHGRYSLELGRACVDAAFSFSEVERLIGAAAPANKSSCRLMELCGLSRAQLVQRPCENGQSAELLEHRISRAQWSGLPARRAFVYVDVPARRPARASEPDPAFVRVKPESQIVVETLSLDVTMAPEIAVRPPALDRLGASAQARASETGS